MIEWREQKTELPLHPIDMLLSRLPEAAASAVESRCTEGRVIVVDAHGRAVVERHIAGSCDEQGGLLVGEAFTAGDEEIAAVLVRTGIPALDFTSSGIGLRMETGVWTRAQKALRAGELIVGWYHSHPDLGAFFSDTDRTTQRAFFPHPYSAGWVRDPIRAEERWFFGAESETVPPQRLFHMPLN